MQRYDHVQHGFLHYILWAVGVALATWGGLSMSGIGGGGAPGLVIPGGLLLALTPFFARLTTRDRGQWLEVAFGPIPLLRRRVRYDQIRSVRKERSSILDGWGVHRGTRGWIWNLWGRDCVAVDLEDARGRARSFRIGTDDPDGLFRWLDARRPRAAPSERATAAGQRARRGLADVVRDVRAAGRRIKQRVHTMTA